MSSPRTVPALKTQKTQKEHLEGLVKSVNGVIDKVEQLFLARFSEGDLEGERLAETAPKKPIDDTVQVKLLVFRRTFTNLRDADTNIFASIQDLDQHFSQVKRGIEQDIQACCDAAQIDRQKIPSHKKQLLEAIVDLYHTLAILRWSAQQLLQRNQSPSDMEYLCTGFQQSAQAAQKPLIDRESQQAYEQARADDLTALESKVTTIARSFAEFASSIDAAQKVYTQFQSAEGLLQEDNRRLYGALTAQITETQRQQTELERLIEQLQLRAKQGKRFASDVNDAQLDKWLDEISTSPATTLDVILDRYLPKLDIDEIPQQGAALLTLDEVTQSYARLITQVQQLQQQIATYRYIPALPDAAAQQQLAGLADTLQQVVQTYRGIARTLMEQVQQRITEVQALQRQQPDLQPCQQRVASVRQAELTLTQHQTNLQTQCQQQSMWSKVRYSTWDKAAEEINQQLAELAGAVRMFCRDIENSVVVNAARQRGLLYTINMLQEKLKECHTKLAIIPQEMQDFSTKIQRINKAIQELQGLLQKHKQLQQQFTELQKRIRKHPPEKEIMRGRDEILAAVRACIKKKEQQARALEALPTEIAVYHQAREALKQRILVRQQRRKQEESWRGHYTAMTVQAGAILATIQTGDDGKYKEVRNKVEQAKKALQLAEQAFTHSDFKEASTQAVAACGYAGEANNKYPLAHWQAQGSKDLEEAHKIATQIQKAIRNYQQETEYAALVGMLSSLEAQHKQIQRKRREEQYLEAVQLAATYLQAARAAQQTHSKLVARLQQERAVQRGEAAVVAIAATSPLGLPTSPLPVSSRDADAVNRAEEGDNEDERVPLLASSTHARAASPQPPAKLGRGRRFLNFLKRHKWKILIGALLLAAAVVVCVFTLGAALPAIVAVTAAVTGLTGTAAAAVGVTALAVGGAIVGGVATAGACAVVERCRSGGGGSSERPWQSVDGDNSYRAPSRLSSSAGVLAATSGVVPAVPPRTAAVVSPGLPQQQSTPSAGNGALSAVGMYSATMAAAVAERGGLPSGENQQVRRQISVG